MVVRFVEGSTFNSWSEMNDLLVEMAQDPRRLPQRMAIIDILVSLQNAGESGFASEQRKWRRSRLRQIMLCDQDGIVAALHLGSTGGSDIALVGMTLLGSNPDEEELARFAEAMADRVRIGRFYVRP